MLALPTPGSFHDHCVVQLLSHDEILRLPLAEREKFSIGGAGPELMRKLLEAHGAPAVLGRDCNSAPESHRLDQSSQPAP